MIPIHQGLHFTHVANSGILEIVEDYRYRNFNYSHNIKEVINTGLQVGKRIRYPHVPSPGCLRVSDYPHVPSSSYLRVAKDGVRLNIAAEKHREAQSLYSHIK